MEVAEKSFEESSLVDKTEIEVSRQFRCTECKKHFESDKALILHMKSHNAQRSGKSGDLYVCQQCGKTAKTRQALERHAAYHQEERPFPCEKCHQRFKNSDDRGKHYRRLKRDGKFEHACTICHKHFKSDELLHKHQVMLGCHSKTDSAGQKKSDNDNNINEAENNLAEGENLSRIDDLEIHSPTDTKPLICRCKMCEIDFTSAESLKKHYRTHHDDAKRQVCIQCGQTLSSRDSLNRHYNIFHQDDFPYPCEHCDQKFKIKESLLRHIKFVHTDGGYICPICSHVFSQPVNLRKHMMVHSTRKDLICEGCGKSFKWKQALEKHILLCCYKPLNELHKNNSSLGEIEIGTSVTIETCDTPEHKLDSAMTESKNVLQRECDVPYDKTVESFDAMDLILNTSDETVPIESFNQTQHDILTPKKGDPANESLDIYGESVEIDVEQVAETIICSKNSSKNMNMEVTLDTKNQSRTITTPLSFKEKISEIIAFDDDVDKSNVDFRSKNQGKDNESSVVHIKRNRKEQELRDININAFGFSVSSTDDNVLKICDEDSSSEKKGNKTDEEAPKSNISKCNISEGGNSKQGQENDSNSVRHNQCMDRSHKTNHTFKPSNLPLIMAPFPNSCQSEKVQDTQKEPNLGRIKEIIQSAETRTQHHRVQKNPFIIQNVSDKMDADSCPSQDTSDGSVLDLSTTQSSRQSPKTKEEVPSGKFSLIKHMLSLQNEEHFDKSLFDNPLYNKPSRIHDFKKLAEMHKISNNVNIEEYDLSAKQNIPIHWLGLGRQNRLETNKKLINIKQSCCDGSALSTSSLKSSEKKVSKRPLDEERPNSKVQKICDKSEFKDRVDELKRKFAENDKDLVEKEADVKRKAVSLFHRNLDSLESRHSMANETLVDGRSNGRTNTSQNDPDLCKDSGNLDRVNKTDTFNITMIAGSRSSGNNLGEKLSSSMKQQKISFQQPNILSSKDVIQKDGSHTKPYDIIDEWNLLNRNKSVADLNVNHNLSNIPVDGSSPSPLKQTGNSSSLFRSNSENFASSNRRSNFYENVSPKYQGHKHDHNFIEAAISPDILQGLNKDVTNSFSVPTKQNLHSTARSLSWPQPYNEDSIQIRNTHIKENNSKNHFDRNLAKSPFITLHASQQKDHGNEWSEDYTDHSEVLLARSLDIIGDSPRGQIPPHLRSTNISNVHNSYHVPFLSKTPRANDSNQLQGCSKSSVIGMPISSHSDHVAAQNISVNSGCDSAIEIYSHSVTYNHTQSNHLNHNLNRKLNSSDGILCKISTERLEAQKVNEFSEPTSKLPKAILDNGNRLQQKNFFHRFVKQNCISTSTETSSTWNTMALGLSKNMFRGQRENSSKGKDELSVVDLLQVPSGTSRLKNHQNIEHFLKHCLE